MRNKVLLVLSALGILSGLFSAYAYGKKKPPPPPVFRPTPNPYERGVFANGIIESAQTYGENLNIYPEVAGTVASIEVHEGDRVRKGQPLLLLDGAVQSATVAQLLAQTEAARAVLQMLKAQPRKEVLDVAQAQLAAAEASRNTAQSQYDKQKRSYDLNAKSVSKDTLDTAQNSLKGAEANVEVARRQYELTKAGAWTFDIQNQKRQVEALDKAYASAKAQLDKFTLRAPMDGVVLSIRVSVGSYASPQGAYDTYTHGMSPVLSLGSVEETLQVRCYVDEILIHNLPSPDQMHAQLFVRGTDVNIPLEYLRIQPFVSPKIQLSNELTERVDVRVLPVIFRFARPSEPALYPGQLVDVYIQAGKNARQPGLGRTPP